MFRSNLFRLFALFCLTVSPLAHAEIKTVPGSKGEMQLSFAPLVKSAAPAVVNIFTTKTVEARARSPLFNDPFFRRFFGDRFNFPQQQGGQRRKVQNSLGSGVIVSADGTIITNHHVIAGADDIKVVLNDRREYAATVLGSDERTDLAVLKVNPEGAFLPTLEFGDSDGLEVGDIVLAIGNPFGVGQTVTSGIVSALARTQVDITDYSFFIQTDAAINPGNSGGALVDMNGRLIGVNSAIYSKAGGSNGIGFAIPANMVRTVLASAGKGEQIVRPWLGAGGQTVTSDLAAQFGLDRPIGVLIDEVYRGGPADDAGLRRGDIILSLNGNEINDPRALNFRLATVAIGDRATLEIIRRQEERTVSIVAEAPPEDPDPDETRLEGYHPFSGSIVANLSPALNDKLSQDLMLDGVAIVQIQRGSTANRLRFRPKDRIVGVNGIQIKTVRDLTRVLDQYAQQGVNWSIGIIRNGQRREFNFRG